MNTVNIVKAIGSSYTIASSNPTINPLEIEGNIDEIDISLDGEVEFKKQGDNLDIRRI